MLDDGHYSDGEKVGIREMDTAPRDGTYVWIWETGYGTKQFTLARVPADALTDEFIPAEASDDAEPSAIPNAACLGWLPRTERSDPWYDARATFVDDRTCI